MILQASIKNSDGKLLLYFKQSGFFFFSLSSGFLFLHFFLLYFGKKVDSSRHFAFSKIILNIKQFHLSTKIVCYALILNYLKNFLFNQIPNKLLDIFLKLFMEIRFLVYVICSLRCFAFYFLEQNLVANCMAH